MSILAAQLDVFLRDLKAICEPPPPEPLAVQLQRFFDRFSALEKPVAVVETPKPAVDWEKTRPQLEQFFSLFSYVQERYNREVKPLGGDIDFWKLSQIGRDEVRNSKVLAWLLDARGDHGQGNAILKGLLRMLARRHGDSTNFPSEVNCQRPYWVRVESCPMGEQESRVDIEIDGDDF